MKYGSLVNILEDGVKIGEIKVGTGVTMLSWTDRIPGTIIEVGNNYIKVQEDIYKRVDNNGMSDCQDYEYTPNPNGTIKTYKKARNGKFTDTGKNSGSGLIIGYRERYFDYSF